MAKCIYDLTEVETVEDLLAALEGSCDAGIEVVVVRDSKTVECHHLRISRSPDGETVRLECEEGS
jgi:hypothetical protein